LRMILAEGVGHLRGQPRNCLEKIAVGGVARGARRFTARKGRGDGRAMRTRERGRQVS